MERREEEREWKEVEEVEEAKEEVRKEVREQKRQKSGLDALLKEIQELGSTVPYGKLTRILVFARQVDEKVHSLLGFSVYDRVVDMLSQSVKEIEWTKEELQMEEELAIKQVVEDRALWNKLKDNTIFMFFFAGKKLIRSKELRDIASVILKDGVLEKEDEINKVREEINRIRGELSELKSASYVLHSYEEEISRVGEEIREIREEMGRMKEEIEKSGKEELNVNVNWQEMVHPVLESMLKEALEKEGKKTESMLMEIREIKNRIDEEIKKLREEMEKIKAMKEEKEEKKENYEELKRDFKEESKSGKFTEILAIKDKWQWAIGIVVLIIGLWLMMR